MSLLGSFTCRKFTTWDRRLYFPSEGRRAEDFFSRKIRRLRPGIKPTRCTNFTNSFWHENLHVSDSSSVHHQVFIHCTLSNGICHIVPSWSCSKAVYKHVWHIPLLSVQWINSWWWTEELSDTCRVSSQNKFVKLVHLVGFVIKKLVRS